jgi:hypothetical protein
MELNSVYRDSLLQTMWASAVDCRREKKTMALPKNRNNLSSRRKFFHPPAGRAAMHG